MSSNGAALPTLNDAPWKWWRFQGMCRERVAYASLDSGLLLNVSSGADAGFANFPTLDPAIVGNLNDSGGVGFGRRGAAQCCSIQFGSNSAFVPPYPGPPSITQGGPDPALSIPSILTADVGSTVLVPVNTDNAQPQARVGLESKGRREQKHVRAATAGVLEPLAVGKLLFSSTEGLPAGGLLLGSLQIAGQWGKPGPWWIEYSRP